MAASGRNNKKKKKRLFAVTLEQTATSRFILGSYMSKSYSFSRIYHLTIATVLFLAIAMIGTFWLVSEYRHHLEALNSLRDDAITERKAIVKALINDLIERIEYQKGGIEAQLKEKLSIHAELGWNIANAIYHESQGRLPEEEIKQLIIATLMPMRFFNGRGYFWIHDANHTLIAHPFRQKSIGTNDADVTDRKGQEFIRSFVQAAKTNPEGAFVSYYWNKPDVEEKYHQEDEQKKIARLKLFEPFNWVIGVGEYVDDVDKQLQQEVVKRIATIRYGVKGYVFTHTRDGVCLNHIKKENIGTNRWELKLVDGMKGVQELDHTGRQPGGGFLEYVGSIDPETGTAAKKLSYVLAVKDWGWVIGSGVYLADIEKKMLEYRQELFGELRNKITTTILLLLGVLAMGILIGRQLFQGLLKELNLFVTESGGEETKAIDLDRFRIKELRNIAHHANVLLEEKEQTQAELQRAKRMESIGLMAGGVAHDLNNILSGIVGYPELLLHDLPKDSALREPIEAIHESGQRAATVVADLLTVARGAASIREIHNLNSLTQEYLNSPEYSKLKSLYPNVTCHHQFATTQAELLCSPVHIKKCLMNLVANAAEAIVNAGEIVVSTYNIQITAADSATPDLEEGVYVVLSIQDTGPGISNTDIAHIFEPFYTKKTMGRSGTGLGLTVVWNTMEDHNGRVFVESDEKGTYFQLFFPVTKKKDLTHGKNDMAKEFTGNGEHIFVVDDESQLRDIASQMLRTLGYKVNSAGSGELAIEFVKKNPVDLIVLDMLMEPGINGRQTYEKILKLYPNQKAIIASGFSKNEDVKATLRLGASGFTKKPYSMNQLGRAVTEALNG
jgi:signal transduction histidine kinase/CheY-like chemotaxis protein